jgi:1-deoxy-D-xylulose-5-phosphate reductoisomerase
MKRIAILGSTGSIGTQALEVISRFPELFEVKALAGNNNVRMLKEQILKFKPELACMVDEKAAIELRTQVDIPVYSGEEGLIKISEIDNSDVVINSIVGFSGLVPTIHAIRKKKQIALANKETLVAAGELVMAEAKKNGVDIIPIDSEHSAIFQCLNGEKKEDVERILLTCSGGPLREKKNHEMENATKDEVLKHPNWNMGQKITVDSATLVNKGLEVIEAHSLFGIPYSKIDVVIHPQSIIHSLIEFKDNSILAQLSNPDMRIPIQYALSYPDRIISNAKKLELTEIKNLSFETPDWLRFPCLRYAYDAGIEGGTKPCIFNAANEIAVQEFLGGKIRYSDIPKVIKKILYNRSSIKNPKMEDIFSVDKSTRIQTLKVINNRSY